MPQTLEQRILYGVERGHFVFNDDPNETRLCCKYCKESLLIDYFQIGITAMNREMTSFVARHKQCKSLSGKLEHGMKRLMDCVMHSNGEKCPVCRGDTD